jgi:hypothetical protein
VVEGGHFAPRLGQVPGASPEELVGVLHT